MLSICVVKTGHPGVHASPPRIYAEMSHRKGESVRTYSSLYRTNSPSSSSFRSRALTNSFYQTIQSRAGISKYVHLPGSQHALYLAANDSIRDFYCILFLVVSKVHKG